MECLQGLLLTPIWLISIPILYSGLISHPPRAIKDGPSEDERFQQASDLCGQEFSEMLEYIVECELPARTLVEEALLGREAVDPSGEVIVFTTGGCPWKTHLYELERAHKVETLVKFVLYQA